MSLPSSSAADRVADALRSLDRSKQALVAGQLTEAASQLARFRASPVGSTVRQLQSDLLELRVTAMTDASQLTALATKLYPRHQRKQNEDAFLCGAAELIHAHVGAAEALDWLEQTINPAEISACGRGRAAALELSLLRQAGRLEEARSMAARFLDETRLADPNPRFWQQCLLTLRGQRSEGRTDLRNKIEGLGRRLFVAQRLRLWNAASASRILVAAVGDVAAPAAGSVSQQRAALTFNRLQASLNARQQQYAAAADNLNQARNLSLLLRGECLETLELNLQRFDMLLQACSVNPSDATWLDQLRTESTSLNLRPYLEYRLANVWRKAGFFQMAMDQYAQVARLYPHDSFGIRAAYQLAVADEDAGNLDGACNRYAAIANTAETVPSVAMFCLIGAYRCATKQNDGQRQAGIVETMQSFGPRIGDQRQSLKTVRHLRDEGLGGLSNALLDHCQRQYESQKANLPPAEYLGATLHLVRRLYEAERYDAALQLVNSINRSYWNSANIAWGYLAGCLHYACLSWQALGRPDNAVAAANSAPVPLSTRPALSAYVDLALGGVYERTRGWARAQDVYNRIVASAPFSMAAMHARVRLARRAWQTGRIEEAQQWAMAVLMDGKQHRKDPELQEVYWSAYSIAATKQGGQVATDDFVYPSQSPTEAMGRERQSRMANRLRPN